MRIGSKKVQQGWLKAINPVMGGTLANGTDTSEVYPAARDAFGFSLHYYPGDYTPVGYTPPATSVLGALSTQATPLYNGNIAAMAVNIPRLGSPKVYNYQYDQLHRIVAMDLFDGLNVQTGSFNPQKEDAYQERIRYYANGNILSYLRHGDSARLSMDNLSYFYSPGTNRLHKVSDAATDAPESTYSRYNDLRQGQADNNYRYDAIGNLISDDKDSINQISWNVYGKISSITKNSSVIRYIYDAAGNRILKYTPTDTTAYVRDASGNVLSVYSRPAGSASIVQSETHLYGSSRLGMATRHQAPDSTILLSGGFGWARQRIFTRGEKLFELNNHLGNVLATVSDRKIALDTNADGITDSYMADVVSANDYYPFGMQMPGRKFSSSEYRYGFNGQEMSNEIKGVGNSYTAEFWEYNPRVGRRWNVDPIDLHIQGGYVAFNNNPVFYVDPNGLYSSKGRAERMRERALKAGRNVGDVRYREKQKDWVFDETRVEVRNNPDGTNETIATNTVFVNKRYFGSASQKIGDFFVDINPVESFEGYFGGLVKTEININKSAKVVVPYGGFQLKANYKNGKIGGDANVVDGRQSYLNVKVGNADFRIMPLNQLGGDYDPGARVLYTMMSRPIIIPVGDLPVPIGEVKLQGDFQKSIDKTNIGIRGAAETFPVPSFQKGESGIKLELNAGLRFELKVPDIFKN